MLHPTWVKPLKMYQILLFLVALISDCFLFYSFRTNYNMHLIEEWKLRNCVKPNQISLVLTVFKLLNQ